ncbi:hypothetical protein EVAR_20689_1 [Eumeta japonica]|uniref:Uncharacterized protein n=1 Tax=Eumeta variegata TaxID=151549 RepID=A0A4C1V9D2_EUMVA|nr:hypothetical protein EVAR_20689_1 [Eumeta japonica]
MGDAAAPPPTLAHGETIHYLRAVHAHHALRERPRPHPPRRSRTNRLPCPFPPPRRRRDIDAAFYHLIRFESPYRRRRRARPSPNGARRRPYKCAIVPDERVAEVGQRGHERGRDAGEPGRGGARQGAVRVTGAARRLLRPAVAAARAAPLPDSSLNPKYSPTRL